MFSDDYDNILPFADCELTTDVYIDLPIFQKPKYKNKTKTKRPFNENKTKTKRPVNEKNTYSRSKLSYIYFENTEDENNFLTFIPYTGPSNTLHLARRLYLPQLTPNNTNDSTVSFQRFIQDYDRTISSLSSSETMSLSIYLRFGISYITKAGALINQSIPLKDFIILQNRGKEITTAFYTCKGVTSPKHLLTTITKLNYQQISSNTYSYDIQLYGLKNNPYSILHFQYNEQLQCFSVNFRPEFPINFDLIRNKTSSIFRSIDHSYSDIFDFRIQLVEQKFLTKTDPHVLDILRGVPIDQVLYIDKSTHVLHVSAKLQKFVKYLKCTRSSKYQHPDEQILISIGTYEEFQLNTKGQCEPLMKASNTMTIELVDLKNLPSGQKLYEIGMWFSTLCQTCVDLPTRTTMEKKSSKWFSNVLRKQTNQSITAMNVNQLTTYKTQKSQQTYTSEELTFVKKILQEENFRKILFDTNEMNDYQRDEIEQIYENMTKRLKTCAVPSAHEALEKVERAYRAICKEFIEE